MPVCPHSLNKKIPFLHSMAPSPQSPLCPVLRNLPLDLKMPLNDDPDNAEAPLVTPATLDGETPLGTPATLDGEDQGEEAMQLKLINEQIHAIKQCISLPEGKRLVYISFDEWASSQGHCVINILISRGKISLWSKARRWSAKGQMMVLRTQKSCRSCMTPLYILVFLLMMSISLLLMGTGSSQQPSINCCPCTRWHFP